MDRSKEVTQASDKDFNTGVIVGRFQVDELTEGHVNLFNAVKAAHPNVMVFLGLSPCKCTVNNPLDFEARKLMILEKYPEFKVLYINDMSSDINWSDNLDRMIKLNTEKTDSICLYGSRDSFLQYYSGVNLCRELVQEIFISGTARRKELAANVNKSKDFRHGVIWATMNQFIKALPTIDVALFNADKTKILLARKTDEQNYRFVGGFVMPGECYEDTAVREVKEETHLSLDNLSYIKSFAIDDWRYSSEVDKITTTLFESTITNETPEPDDDICELRWFPFHESILKSTVVEHLEMMKYILSK